MYESGLGIDIREIARKAAGIIGPVLVARTRPPASPYDPQAQAYPEAPWRFEDIAREALTKAKYQAGAYVASTPEGQAAIKQHLQQQAALKARQFGGIALPLIGLLATVLLMRRRR